MQDTDLTMAQKTAVQKVIIELKNNSLKPLTLKPEYGYSYEELPISIDTTPVTLLRSEINGKEQWYCFFPTVSEHLGSGAKSGVFKCYQRGIGAEGAKILAVWRL